MRFGQKARIVVREYSSPKEYERDANKMVAKGYRVTNVAAVPPKPTTTLLGGIGHLAPNKIIVTYELSA